ncbi:MAG: hypothetical protein ACK4L4_19180 [Gemmobacter sp.]
MRRVTRALRGLEDSWVGDLIGVVCLFAGLWLALVAAFVLEGR